MYTRMGIDIQTLGFLGRWRSSAVFRYVEEAMKEMPLNKQTKLGQGAKPEPPSSIHAGGETLEVIPGRQDIPVPAPAPEIRPQEELPLWAVSRSRDKAIIHRVREASWNLPLNEWKTACGRHFARQCEGGAHEIPSRDSVPLREV